MIDLIVQQILALGVTLPRDFRVESGRHFKIDVRRMTQKRSGRTACVPKQCQNEPGEMSVSKHV
jgi:hypothetical protein